MMDLSSDSDTSDSEKEDEKDAGGSEKPINEDRTTKKIIILEAQNRKILKPLSKLPGAPIPVATEARKGYAQSPFSEEVTKIKIPKKLHIPAMPKLYDGTTDPVDHVAQYKQKMWQLPIPANSMEATMCKSFGATLCGPALQWLINIKSGSIGEFASLVNKFY